MKKFTIVLLAALFLANLALAQDTTPKTKMGDEAFLFTFDGLANLGAGNYGGGLGAKYYFQDDMAFRAGLSFNWSGWTQKQTGGAPDQTDNTIGFGLSPAITYNLATNGAVVAYVGGAASFNWSSRTREYLGNDKEVNTTTSFGIGGLAGFEWFAWNNMSLGAEYQLMLSLGSGSDEVTNGTTTTKTDRASTTNLGLGSSGAVTLSVYF